MNRYVIIVAGGKGLRMGADVPKQFLPLQGRPVLMHTIDVFRRACAGIHIILVLPREQQAYWTQLCKEHGYDVSVQVADGGETRFHSVLNGLAKIPDDAQALVGVHDGVRPFVSAETIERCFEAAARSKAAVPVVPVVETVRQLLPDGGSKTVNRDLYKLVQTPQTFDVQMLKQAYGQAYDPLFTDDASVVEAMGVSVELVEGNRENIKLTNPADLRMAEGMMS